MSANTNKPLRIYSISLPKPASVFPWLVLFVGVVSFCFFQVIFQWTGVWDVYTSPLKTVVFRIHWLILIVMSFIFANEARQELRRRRAVQPRIDRLSKLIDVPHFASRSPHRLVEFAACKQFIRWTASRRSITRAVLRALQVVPAGCIIASNLTSKTSGCVPLADGRRFEPKPLTDVATQLIGKHYPDDSSKLRSVRRLGRLGGSSAPSPTIFATAIAILGFGLYVTLSYFVNRRSELFGVMFAIVGFPLIAIMLVGIYLWFRNCILGKAELLIPGGIVVVRAPFWKAKGYGVLLTRNNAVILADEYMRSVYVTSRGCHFQFREVKAVLSTWINTSRIPTREEIASFLGPKYDVRD